MLDDLFRLVSHNHNLFGKLSNLVLYQRPPIFFLGKHILSTLGLLHEFTLLLLALKPPQFIWILITALVVMLACAGLSVSLKHEVFIVNIIFLEGLWQKLTTKNLRLVLLIGRPEPLTTYSSLQSVNLLWAYLMMLLLLDFSCLLSISFLAHGSSSSSKKAFSSSVNFIRFAFYSIVKTNSVTLLRLCDAWPAYGAWSLGCSVRSKRWGF